MPTNSVVVSQLIDSCPRFSWQEALALVQSLIAAGVGAGCEGPSSGTYEEFLIHEDGTVTVAEGRQPALSVSEVALLLTRVLPSENAEQGTRAPTALHFAIARALGLVEAAPFATMSRFSDALARFEHADRASVLRGVFDRCTATDRAPQIVAIEREATGGWSSRAAAPGAGHRDPSGADRPGHAAVRPKADRRRSGPSSDVLRRLLREEDRVNYSLSARARQQHRHAAPPADVLRRLIREADERNFQLSRRPPGIAPPLGTAWRRHAVGASVGLLIVAAGGAVVDREYRSITAPPAPPIVVALRGAAAPVISTPTLAQVGAPDFAGASADSPHARSSPRTRRTASVARGNRAVISKVPKRASRETSARHAITTTLSSPEAPNVAPTPSVRALGGDEPAIHVPTDSPRRGPVPRFFAAVYRGLGWLARHPGRSDEPDPVKANTGQQPR